MPSAFVLAVVAGLEVECEQTFLTLDLFHYLLHAESGLESVPPASVTSALDDTGVQGSPVLDNCGQGLPETNSSVSASGDLILHSVSCHAFFCAGGGSGTGTKLGIKTKRLSFDRCQFWS